MATSYQYKHIPADTATTVLHSRAATLRYITINTKGATSNTLTVYNNTAGSGDVVAVIDTTSTIGTLRYDVQCPAGITVVSASGTGADLTICTEGPGV